MFRFEQIEILHTLWVIPILVLIYWMYISYRKRQLNELGRIDLLKRLAPGLQSRTKHGRFILLIAALAMLLIAYANPQWGTKKEKTTAQSSDIFLALDISQSMMAEDISPNRLERAKRLTQNIIQTLRGNRLGLIYFAGSAYLQMPLSSDYAAAQLFVSSANTGQASTQGTAIAEAIDLAMRAYEEDKPFQRALIVITDGENHEEAVIQKAQEAKEKGLTIYVIGIGTEEGAFVPFISQGREQFKRDESGSPVKSSLNVELIQDLARAGGGRAYYIGDGNEIFNKLKREIALLEKQEVEQRAFSDYASYFQYLLAMGILLLLIEFIIPENLSNRIKERVR